MSKQRLSSSAREDEWDDRNHEAAQPSVNTSLEYDYVQSKICQNNTESDFCESKSEKQSNSMQRSKWYEQRLKSSVDAHSAESERDI